MAGDYFTKPSEETYNCPYCHNILPYGKFHYCGAMNYASSHEEEKMDRIIELLEEIKTELHNMKRMMRT